MKKFEDLTLEELQEEYNQLKNELINEIYPALKEARKQDLAGNTRYDELKERELEIDHRLKNLKYRINYLIQKEKGRVLS